jgi:hypothetical protein
MHSLGVIKISKSKDRQLNDQKKKTTIYKTLHRGKKDSAASTSLKPVVNSCAPEW